MQKAQVFALVLIGMLFVSPTAGRGADPTEPTGPTLYDGTIPPKLAGRTRNLRLTPVHPTLTKLTVTATLATDDIETRKTKRTHIRTDARSTRSLLRLNINAGRIKDLRTVTLFVKYYGRPLTGTRSDPVELGMERISLKSLAAGKRSIVLDTAGVVTIKAEIAHRYRFNAGEDTYGKEFVGVVISAFDQNRQPLYLAVSSPSLKELADKTMPEQPEDLPPQRGPLGRRPRRRF